MDDNPSTIIFGPDTKISRNGDKATHKIVKTESTQMISMFYQQITKRVNVCK